MFGKRLSRHFGSTFSKARGVVAGAYGNIRNIAQAVDRGVDIASRLHSAVQPLMNKSEYGRAASKAITSGMQDYAFAKDKAMDQFTH